MNNRIDVILVACGMIIGFIVIIMHLTGLGHVASSIN